MKKTVLLLVSLTFTGDLFAQAAPRDPAPATAPVRVAQAVPAPSGSAASGASMPQLATGATSNLAAFIGLGVAGIAAAGSSYSTTSNH